MGSIKVQRAYGLLATFVALVVACLPEKTFARTWESYQSELALLPLGNGRELVAANCSACHSLQLVAQARLSRAHWDRTITWMQQTQKMWDLPAELRAPILDYLALHFGLSEPHAGGSATRDRFVNPLPEAIAR